MSAAIKKAILCILVLFLLIVSLFPLVWSICGSFKSSSEMYAYPYDFLPKSPTLVNFKTLFNISNFLNCLKNSIFVSLLATFASLVISCLASYSLTRFSYPGARLLKRLMMESYMIPSILLILPIYSFITNIGLRDNLWAYALMVLSTTLPFCLWLFNSYFAGITPDFEEAAMVDGETRFMAFYKIVLPMLTPAIVAVGIQAFILVWNDLLFAKILLSSENNRTLPLVISSMFAQDQVYPWGVILAGTMVATVPVLFMFVFGVDKLIGGWSEGGVKG